MASFFAWLWPKTLQDIIANGNAYDIKDHFEITEKDIDLAYDLKKYHVLLELFRHIPSNNHQLIVYAGALLLDSPLYDIAFTEVTRKTLLVKVDNEAIKTYFRMIYNSRFIPDKLDAYRDMVRWVPGHEHVKINFLFKYNFHELALSEKLVTLNDVILDYISKCAYANLHKLLNTHADAFNILKQIKPNLIVAPHDQIACKICKTSGPGVYVGDKPDDLICHNHKANVNMAVIAII